MYNIEIRLNGRVIQAVIQLNITSGSGYNTKIISESIRNGSVHHFHFPCCHTHTHTHNNNNNGKTQGKRK